MSLLQESIPSGEIVVPMAEIAVTNDPNTWLVAASLGSSMAVAVHDPEVRVAGILHFLLPRYELNRKKALENPSLFANTGIPQLYRRCYKLGAEKERMVCYLIGASGLIGGSESFRLGSDNYEAAVQALAQSGVEAKEEWVGGTENRTVRLYAADGTIKVDNNLFEEAAA